MSQDFDNNLRGVLFKNDRKETESHPLYKGSCEIEGVQFWISAWLKDSPQKGKYMSLSFSPKEAKPATKPAAKPAARAASTGFDNMDDDVPF